MSQALPAFPVPESLTNLVGQFQGRCPVCKLPAYINGVFQGSEMVHGVLCTRCGSYKIQFPFAAYFKPEVLSPRQIATISGYIRENPGVQISTEEDVNFLCELSSPTVSEKASKLLAALARLHPKPGVILETTLSFIDNQMTHFLSMHGEKFPSDPAADRAALALFPCLSTSWTCDEAELRFVLVEYLSKGVGLLDILNEGGHGQPIQFQISPKGWDHLQSSGVANSATGFVAMWFSGEMVPVWEKAFYPAIKAAGYSPLRIDKKEHNNKIDDEIMASIRGSRFIVADFTGERGGVYFEAGYAGGLGKPVIWTVRKDWLNKLHFDTRQFNHITWSEDNLAGFAEALRLRIEATIGKGSFR
ncbi:MAG: nucleoside 2-deoxyribosyltransferase [Verrucomicrobiaceae bacterium]|nr:nucleoside 2-deoxyribosyltransferase [Verrucomicrobiaceae bacterium]